MKYILNDLSGQKFGDWIAIKIINSTKDSHRIWLCRCKNGHEKEILGTNLNRGKSKNCYKCRK